MAQNRRDFLKLFGTAGASLASGGFTLGGVKLLSPSGLGVQSFTAVGDGTRLEDAAFWAGSFAMEVGSPDKDTHNVKQLRWKRGCLEKCSAEHVALVKKHMNDAIEWYAAIPHNVDTLGPLAKQAGARETLRLLNLPQEAFEAELQRQIEASGEQPKQQPKDIKPAAAEPLPLTQQAKRLAIHWDTIKGATTRRIKITVPETNDPQAALAAFEEKLRAAFPKDDIDLNHSENRIYIRNPSKALVETLKPHLLQKNQHREL